MLQRMRLLLAAVCVTGLVMSIEAQQPGGRPGVAPQTKDKAPEKASSSLVARMMAYDKNKDGKLTKEEITDERLLRLFDKADANKDGVVTKEELEAFAAKEEAQGGGRGFGGPGGPDGDDGPGGRGPGGPGGRGPGGPGGPGGFGGRGGMGGRPQPGQVLPAFMQDNLKLSADQKKQLDGLQKEVDLKLAKILTDEQKAQLKQMSEGMGRPGGPGGRGPGGRGPGGPGGPGGPPPERPDQND